MDEDEIDAKYEEDKETLMDEYIDALDKGADRDKTATVFQKKFKKVHDVYSKRMEKALWQKNHPPLYKKLMNKIQPPPPKQ